MCISLTLSWILLKNDQTYFKNFVMFTPQHCNILDESVKGRLGMPPKSHKGFYQPAFTCSKSTIETLKQYVKSVQI